MERKKVISMIVLAVAFTLGMSGFAQAATSVNLGTANSFAVLAGSGITNTGPTTIAGDIGTYPTLSETGFGSITLTGTNNVGNGVTQGAKTDLTTGYNAAAGQTPVTTVATELGGTTKVAGVYDSASGTFGITGTLTLDAQNDPSAIFVFKADSTLITEVDSKVALINGAQACNIYWQVGSSATLKTNSIFNGNILALTSITLNNGATVNGSVLAQNGAVTLDTNTITRAVCLAMPHISVTNIPTPSALTSGAGSVTHNFTVTNTGTVPMSNVTVTDDKYTGINYVSGDTNGDSKLDVNETWLYRVVNTVSTTTTDTVTATGKANGYTATAGANATVTVSDIASGGTTAIGGTTASGGTTTGTGTTAITTTASPKLPATGIAPSTNYSSKNIAFLAGALLVLASSALIIRRLSAGFNR